jgi:uncharacterized Zn-binding protein involved in type VI secretion
VKVETGTRLTVAFALLSTLVAFAGSAPGDKNDKPKPSANTVIDSGSFGVFIQGKRVATETFTVQQQNGTSVIKSQFKETDGADAASQKSDLEMSSSGELIHYEWNQSSGGSLSVFPDNEFLKERISASASAKPAEQAFLLPTATPVLDNNFFVHREVLAWKYLAVAPCKDEKDHRRCEPADFGALVPQDRTSMSVRMELIGKEKVMIRGAERELLRMNLHGETFDWALWVDESDHFKLIRVAIPADNTEVVRD